MNSDAGSLERLHDLVVPPPVPHWPPAVGWYWVIGLVGVLVLAALLCGFLRWQNRRYRREALAEWSRLAAQLSDPAQRARVLTEMAVLEKRVALTAYPRRSVASLNGRVWLNFLGATTRSRDYSTEAGALPEAAAFGLTSGPQQALGRVQEAAALARRWIEDHDPERRPPC